MKPTTETAARAFAIESIRSFVPNPMHGPVSDVIGLAALLSNKTVVLRSGDERVYISIGSPKGETLLFHAARENYEAFLLAKRVAASRIACERPLGHLIGALASAVLLDTFPVPKVGTGPKVHESWHKGVFIYVLSKRLTQLFEVRPTENPRKGKSLSAMTLIPEASRLAGNPNFQPVTPNTVRKWVLKEKIRKELDAAIEELGPSLEPFVSSIDIDKLGT